MQIEAVYSHKDGEKFIQDRHAAELKEVCDAVAACDAVWCLRKITKESTKGALLFSPTAFNLKIKKFLHPLGWTEPAPNSKKGYKEPRINFGRGQFREMDGVKNKVGLEIQFGKYAFMGYDILSKMPLFAGRGLIECGIEVVAARSVCKEMSTGVSSFDQIVVDLQNRGAADLDVPTLVIGISLTEAECQGCVEKRERFRTQREAMLASGELSSGNKGSSPGPKGDEFDYDESEEELAEEET